MFLTLYIKIRTLPASASDRQIPSKSKDYNTEAPLCRMLLSVCMKDYVARSYGHTPRKLPLKGVPSRATSRFIAYQALLLYTILSFLSIMIFYQNLTNFYPLLLYNLHKFLRFPQFFSPALRSFLHFIIYIIYARAKPQRTAPCFLRLLPYTPPRVSFAQILPNPIDLLIYLLYNRYILTFLIGSNLNEQ